MYWLIFDQIEPGINKLEYLSDYFTRRSRYPRQLIITTSSGILPILYNMKKLPLFSLIIGPLASFSFDTYFRSTVLILFLIANSCVIADELSNLISDVQNAETPEEMRDASRLLNELVNEDFEQVKSMAKSPVSIEFINLTERQNQLSKLSEPLVDKMIIIMHQLENMGFEEDDRIGVITQAGLSVELCQLAKKNNTIITEILSILDKKVQYINNPTIIKEMFYGDASAGEFIMRLRDSQAEILAREEQGYINFQCDELLTQFTPL